MSPGTLCNGGLCDPTVDLLLTGTGMVPDGCDPLQGGGSIWFMV